MAVSQALSPVIDLVFPPRCPLCGEALAAQSGLCAGCWGELAIPGEPACARCRRPLAEGALPGMVCGPCLADPPTHDGIYAATLYNDASRKLVLAFKHGRRIALAGLLARQIAARMPPLEGDWVLVPVPLHRWRLWQRGFNQAALLAGELARLTGHRLVVDGLERRKRTPSLGGLGRAARRKALAGAIEAAPRRRGILAGSQVILVDDVLTSGATSAACVSALKRAGARKVVVACFARVLDEALPLADNETPEALRTPGAT